MRNETAGHGLKNKVCALPLLFSLYNGWNPDLHGPRMRSIMRELGLLRTVYYNRASISVWLLGGTVN